MLFAALRLLLLPQQRQQHLLRLTTNVKKSLSKVDVRPVAIHCSLLRSLRCFFHSGSPTLGLQGCLEDIQLDLLLRHQTQQIIMLILQLLQSPPLFHKSDIQSNDVVMSDAVYNLLIAHLFQQVCVYLGNILNSEARYRR